MEYPIEQIDSLLKEGQGEQARRLLRRISPRKVPRELALPLAALARRAGSFTFALRFLNPIVRPSSRRPKRATSGEKAEYAASLAFLGLAHEATEILDTIGVEERPEAGLYRAFALFGQWAYGDAVPFLQKYVGAPGLNEYERLVGKVNLAAALVYEQDEKAGQVLTDVRREAEAGRHTRLLGNYWELSAQHSIHEGDWAGAQRALKESEKALKALGALDDFFVRKWRAVLTLARGRGRAPLAQVRSRARELQHWETLRDCDRYEGQFGGSVSLLYRVYFGTPFEAFRKKILKDADLKLPPTYEVPLGPAGSAHLDLEAGQLGGRAKLKDGQNLHRLLCCLGGDLYSPQTVASIHDRVFKGEYFNPESSPDRVHQTLKRLRRFLHEHRVPLSVSENQGLYWLSSQKGCTLIFRPPDSLNLKGPLLRLRTHFGEAPFSSSDACKVLKTSPSQIHRLLREPEAKETLVREGGGRSTRYRFAA